MTRMNGMKMFERQLGLNARGAGSRCLDMSRGGMTAALGNRRRRRRSFEADMSQSYHSSKAVVLNLYGGAGRYDLKMPPLCSIPHSIYNFSHFF